MIQDSPFRLGAGLYCTSCGRRVTDGPRVEVTDEPVLAPDGTVLARRRTARLVASCRCGARQVVAMRGGRRQ